MSYENSKLKDLVEEIKATLNEPCTSDILYHLFDGDYVEDAFSGSSLVEGIEYKLASKVISDYLNERGYEAVESEGGGEGESEYCYGVIKVGDEYYKAEWNYYSYQGCDYDSIEDTVRKVTPTEKVVTVYE